MSARRATRNDVAARAGVSTAVVSYVVNNGPRPVAEATRKRVTAAIEALGYRPNLSARALKLDKTNVVGLLVDNLTNPFFSELATYLQHELNLGGSSVLLGSTELDSEVEQTQIDALLRHEVDGIVVFDLTGESALDRLRSSGAPIVSLDWDLNLGIVPAITVDAYGATQEAIAHLRGHGFDEVAFIGGPEPSRISTTRLRAWRDANSALSAERVAELEFFGTFSNEGGYEAGKELLASPTMPGAVFVSSDVQAVGLLRACHEAGVRVPADLAILSFDGTQVSEFSTPSLSAVHVPLEKIAHHAAAWVLSQHEGVDNHITVPLDLVLRESCGCEPARASWS